MLAEKLSFKEKVERSLALIEHHYSKYGNKLVAANSLGKDSVAVWHLAKRVSPNIKGFVVTTRYKPQATRDFMFRQKEKYPELEIYENYATIPDRLYETDPSLCCDMLKVEMTKKAVEGISCWVTGLRCTEGHTRTDFEEVEERDKGLIKLNPILYWYEREVWQYLALNKVDVNPLYNEGYRSLGCEPCSKVTAGGEERDGRWQGTTRQGAECGIHSKSLKP